MHCHNAFHALEGPVPQVNEIQREAEARWTLYPKISIDGQYSDMTTEAQRVCKRWRDFSTTIYSTGLANTDTMGKAVTQPAISAIRIKSCGCAQKGESMATSYHSGRFWHLVRLAQQFNHSRVNDRTDTREA